MFTATSYFSNSKFLGLLRSKSSNSPMNTNTHLFPRESLNFLRDMKVKSSTCKKLQDICVITVCENFEKIMKYYFTNEEANSKKLEYLFLKKRYSKTIFEILSYQKTLKESYLPFVINLYIEELNLSSYPFTDIKELVKILKNVGHKILKINLSGTTWKRKTVIELFQLMPNLKSVHLDFTRFKNDVLGILPKKCPFVNHITLSHNDWITDRSLHFLCTLNEMDDLVPNPTIEILDLIGTKVSVDGIIFALQYFPSLKSLKSRYVAQALHSLHHRDVIKNTLHNLPSKYGINEVDIYADCPILEVLHICTRLCPSITTLYVNQISSQEEMDVCMRFHTLKVAQLVFNRHANLMCPPEFFNLHASSLEVLTIVSATFSLKSLIKCKKLQILNLTFPLFEEFDSSLLPISDHFVDLFNLEFKNLDLSESNTLNCVLYILSSCPNVNRLTFHQAFAFPNYAMDKISECKCIKNLSDLDMSFSIIKYSGLERMLSVASHLKGLVIECCDISKTEFESAHEKYPAIDIIWGNEWI